MTSLFTYKQDRFEKFCFEYASLLQKSFTIIVPDQIFSSIDYYLLYTLFSDINQSTRLALN